MTMRCDDGEMRYATTEAIFVVDTESDRGKE